jgi:hypothetical protein
MVDLHLSNFTLHPFGQPLWTTAIMGSIVRPIDHFTEADSVYSYLGPWGNFGTSITPFDGYHGRTRAMVNRFFNGPIGCLNDLRWS